MYIISDSVAHFHRMNGKQVSVNDESLCKNLVVPQKVGFLVREGHNDYDTV